MLVYLYSKKNPHIFLGTNEYDTNSRRSLLEVNATTVKPPLITTDQLAIYDIVRKSWAVIKDYRNLPIEQVNGVYDHRELRRNTYPSLDILADALVHNHNGDPVPLQEYYNLCNAVKAKYPK